MDNFVADSIFIDAPAARVFAALLDPADIQVWMDAEEASVQSSVNGVFSARRADGARATGRIAHLEPGKKLQIDDYFWEVPDERRGPMVLTFILEDRMGGVWITVRQDRLDCGKSWQAFAQSTRRELVRWTVRMKRHIEQI